MNETLQTIKARRSVRAYTEQQVFVEDLNLILEAATYAPSGMHLETWHFTAIQNKEVLEELNDKIKGALPRVTTSIHGSVDTARLIVATIMPPRWSLSPTSLPNGGLLWIALALWRIFFLQPSPSASVPAGLTSWGRPATTPMSALS